MKQLYPSLPCKVLEALCYAIAGETIKCTACYMCMHVQKVLSSTTIPKLWKISPIACLGTEIATEMPILENQEMFT